MHPIMMVGGRPARAVKTEARPDGCHPGAPAALPTSTVSLLNHDNGRGKGNEKDSLRGNEKDTLDFLRLFVDGEGERGADEVGDVGDDGAVV